MRVCRLLLIAVALPLPTTLAQSEGGAHPSIQQGWEELSLLKANEAQATFVTAGAADSNREARLGEALALLQLRAKSPATVAEASRILASLRSENPDDNPGIASSYYLARIAQIHGYTSDRAAAVAGYRALLAAHPEHHYAQLAAPKLATLLLYDDVPLPEWEVRVREVESLLTRLTAPEAVRDTRLTLAMAFIRLRHDYAHAYPLLCAALHDGTVTRLTRLNTVLVQTAEAASQLGRAGEAAGYYARFLESFPQDVKSDEVRRRLAALKREARP